MVRNERTLMGLAKGILLCVLLIMIPTQIRGESRNGRFFLMGDGKIHIKNKKTGREAWATLLNPDGSMNEEGFAKIDGVFGFPTKEKGEHISPRMLFMLDYFSDLVAPGKVINLESGYRSPEYNTKLRNKGANAAKTSTHLDGMAIDFNIRGVNGKELWKLIKSKDCCGIGHYGGANVHLDSARPRFWEAATSKVRTNESDYNRRIYLSTDYDRYKAGDTVRLSFSSVSDFGFGLKRTAVFVDDSEGYNRIVTTRIWHRGDTDCVKINDRKASRFIFLTLPTNLSRGRYRIRVDFCQRPFEQMPLKAVSNEIEVVGHVQ